MQTFSVFARLLAGSARLKVQLSLGKKAAVVHSKIDHKRHRAALPAGDAVLLGIVVTAALTSLWGLALLAVGEFRPGPMSIGLAASLAAAVVRLRSAGAGIRFERVHLGILLCAFLGAVCRSNPAAYIYGGQDPGVYANTAAYFAAHGSAVVRDPLLPELSDHPEMRAFYVKRSFRDVQKAESGGWFGSMVPGIFILDLDKNEWNPQFYYLHPLWLAVGQWLVGLERQGAILVLFSCFGIIAAALIVLRLSRSPEAALLAAFILALNPAHAGIAVLPVSETVASFFFLGAVLAIVHRRYGIAALSALGLFLTRITGFVALPLFLAALLWSIIKRRDRGALILGGALIAAYAGSYYWGLAFSPIYSADIYRSKLGVSADVLQHAGMFFAALLGGWFVLGGIALQRGSTAAGALRRLAGRHRTVIAVTVVGLVLGCAVYRGYLLAFTDAYTGHRWFGVRWGMAGRGFQSVQHLSLYTLGLFLSPALFAAALLGLVWVSRSALTRAASAPVAILTVGFLGALTIKQLTVPYLYYFGRYHVSELLPLLVICACLGFAAALRRRRGLALAAASVVAVLYAGHVAPVLSAQLRVEQGREFLDGMKCIDALTPGKSVIFIDKKLFAEAPIVTPLRMAFDKMTFSLRPADAPTSEAFGAYKGYFEAKGYHVFLLSSRRRWEGKADLQPVMRVPLLMRTIGGRRALPRRVRTRDYSVWLYSSGEPQPLPPICEQVKAYRK